LRTQAGCLKQRFANAAPLTVWRHKAGNDGLALWQFTHPLPVWISPFQSLKPHQLVAVLWVLGHKQLIAKGGAI